MPDRLSLRSALLLAALAFGLMLPVQMLLGGGSSAAEPAGPRSAPKPVADVPGAAPDLRLVAAKPVPALRDPRKPRKRLVRPRKPAPKPKPAARPAPTPPAPVMRAAPPQPAPTAAPRYVPPAPRAAPRYVPPAPRRTPAPTPKPKPTAPPASGEFDTTGES